jgi:cytoskeletal protein CcmA (bactofilin family)
VKINGQIYSKEDLYVDGDVEGTIELQEHRLTIGPNGRVRSNVEAREVVILGNVQGNVDVSDKLEVRKDACVVGDITTARIVIEDGAYFKGSIDIVKLEPAKSSAAAVDASRLGRMLNERERDVDEAAGTLAPDSLIRSEQPRVAERSFNRRDLIW